VRDADALLAIVNGTPPDEGVMLELGAAIALGKPVFLYRDDFRRCSDSEDYPLKGTSKNWALTDINAH
jgi:nucleoside 2-deoxyribosyltransferase